MIAQDLVELAQFEALPRDVGAEDVDVVVAGGGLGRGQTRRHVGMELHPGDRFCRRVVGSRTTGRSRCR